MILNTRPQVYNESFARDFGDFGVPIVESPLLDAQSIQAWPPSANDFDAVIVTSPYALRLCPPNGGWRSKTIFAVGAATASAARTARFHNVICTGQTAVDMIAKLKTEAFRQAFYPSGQDVAVDLSQSFGPRVSRSVVYRMNVISEFSATATRELETTSEVFVPLFSRRSAEAFGQALQNFHAARRAHLTVIGISRAAIAIPAAPWDEEVVADSPTSASMSLALERHLNRGRLAA